MFTIQIKCVCFRGGNLVHLFKYCTLDTTIHLYLYLSALFTILASSFDVDAAFTSLFLFSSELSQVLLWERSIPEDRFTLGPLNTHTYTHSQFNSGSDNDQQEEVTVNHWASSCSISIRLLCLSTQDYKYHASVTLISNLHCQSFQRQCLDLLFSSCIYRDIYVLMLWLLHLHIVIGCLINPEFSRWCVSNTKQDFIHFLFWWLLRIKEFKLKVILLAHFVMIISCLQKCNIYVWQQV